MNLLQKICCFASKPKQNKTTFYPEFDIKGSNIIKIFKVDEAEGDDLFGDIIDLFVESYGKGSDGMGYCISQIINKYSDDTQRMLLAIYYLGAIKARSRDENISDMKKERDKKKKSKEENFKNFSINKK